MHEIRGERLPRSLSMFAGSAQRFTDMQHLQSNVPIQQRLGT